MKKLIAIFLTIALISTLAACGNDTGKSLLSQGSENIAQVKIFFPQSSTRTTTLTKDDASSVIAAIDKIKAAEQEIPQDDDWTNFQYSFEITYADESVDYLYSNEQGDEYFCFTNNDTAILKGAGKDLKSELEKIQNPD